MANTTIQIRTDAEVKSAADSIFNKLGITMSDGINIFLRQVNLYGGFPFEVKLPVSGAAGFAGESTQRYPDSRAHIRGLYGKYKASTFSTRRYLEQKRREKKQEK